MKLDELKKMAKTNKVEYVDLKFSDLPGAWHHITIPVSALNTTLFKSGIGVDGSALPGFVSIERGDMILLPDPSTAFIDPFFDIPTLSMIGDIMDVGDKILPYSRNPRRVAQFAEKYLNKIVKGAQVFMGPEFEFYIFDKVNFYQGPDNAFYYLESREGLNSSNNEDGLAYKIPYKKGYHVAPPFDRTFNLRSEISAMLAKVGVGLKYHHHEVGGGGQHEIETKFQPLLKMADQSMLVKYFIKNLCFRHNRSATFMPKPLFNEPGSGLHVHQYLADAKGNSLFYGNDKDTHFSRLGLQFLGGLLKHADSILAFSNPSTNSYKRLIPGFEAPVAGTYSVGNRTACIRIPGYQRDPKMMRFEFRPGDGTMNFYLGYSAMLMAGLDGIRNKIDPGKPLDKNLDTISKKELAKIHQLPTSLTKALNALEKDYEYLLIDGVFTEDLIENWIKIKREDVKEIRVRPTPHEFELYYEC